MTPEAFAIRCQEIVATLRGHEAHRALDFLTNDALRELGYGEGIAVFETAVAHWHAAADPYPYLTPCPDCDSRLKRVSGETGTGSIGEADESAVAKPIAQVPPLPYKTIYRDVV